MNRVLAAAVVVAAFLAGSNLHAQTRQSVTLQPQGPPHVDLAVSVGWLGNVSDATPYRNWYQRASADLSAGYYWTPHLKVELDVATTTEGEVYGYETIYVPGDTFPYYRTRSYRFRSTQASGVVAYQFLENRWFHPFVAAGLQIDRSHEQADASQQGPPLRGTGAPFVIPALPALTSVTYIGRPLVGGGFKAYVSERAFIRSDVRASFSSTGVESLVWRAGVGVDF